MTVIYDPNKKLTKLVKIAIVIGLINLFVMTFYYNSGRQDRKLAAEIQQQMKAKQDSSFIVETEKEKSIDTLLNEYRKNK